MWSLLFTFVAVKFRRRSQSCWNESWTKSRQIRLNKCKNLHKIPKDFNFIFNLENFKYLDLINLHWFSYGVWLKCFVLLCICLCLCLYFGKILIFFSTVILCLAGVEWDVISRCPAWIAREYGTTSVSLWRFWSTKLPFVAVLKWLWNNDKCQCY